jgi:hypothetical protein
MLAWPWVMTACVALSVFYAASDSAVGTSHYRLADAASANFALFGVMTGLSVSAALEMVTVRRFWRVLVVRQAW